MRTYEITFRILPAGVGPDGYESADLEQRTRTYDFPDPGPDDVYELAGDLHAYGPPHAAMEAAIRADLAEGEHPIIGQVRHIHG